MSMKKSLIAIPVAALAGSLILVGCSDEGATCAPNAAGAVALKSVEFPLRPSGGGGGGGRGGGGGGSKGGSSSKSGGSYGSSKGGSSSKGGGSSKPVTPRKPTSGYKPRPGTSAPPTYVRQSDGSWLPFVGGVLVGEALSDAPEGCR
ncbi:hypothetical protein SEA_NANOSMITE_121 [Mycobacterium phage Nanosmite]|nr:hypothetical protein SEA_NANOSMITE_121 [Mycobacterium phage Nanosmite]